jgi:hypothetical protein
MRSLKVIAPLVFFLLFAVNEPSPSRGRGAIDVVFCLDLSGSTNGLIDDVREKLWDIVNQVNSFRPAPDFRIGVVAFSRPSFGAKNGYVKVLHKLTSDFDALNFELYKLKPSIEKGDQLVGEAIRVSVNNMNWANDDDALKVIYVTGNGMVNMGGNDFRSACDLAVKKNIILNTLYCRTRNNAEKELPGWREIARLGGGEQYDIRVHKRTPVILTSTDPSEMRTLSEKLTDTYMYFGEKGEERYKMMASNDKNAMVANDMSFESRLFYKISDRYQFHQQSWDLVDYIKMSNSPLTEIDQKFLQEANRFKTPAELKELSLKKKDERTKIISYLRRHLPYDRQAVINKKLEDRDIDKADIFERVVINSLNDLAATRGINTGVSASTEFRR